ncbi:MAG: DUF2125 domain-containing protein [Pseudomonadota bacterium]
MSENNVKPAYNAKRRIQLLFGFVVMLIVGITAGWFYVAGKIDTAAGDAIEQQAALGNDVRCDGRDVLGYPFRFGLFCDAFAFESQPQGLVFKAGAVRSAAQFYAPRDLIVELDGPANVERSGLQSIWIDWSQMRARILATEPLPQNISVSGQDIIIGQSESQPLLKAAALELFMRVAGSDVDIAGRTTDFEFESQLDQLNNLPPLGGDFDIRVTDGARLLLEGQQSLRGVDAMIKRVALLLNDDRGIIVSGPATITDDGLLSGDLSLRVVDVDAVLAVLTKALPDAAPLMTAFANGQPRTGENSDEIELQITIDGGQARLGLIPLGMIPPI